jgi:hypothetical protein
MRRIAVGNGLCAVPAGCRFPRNATEGVPYRRQSPDTLSYAGSRKAAWGVFSRRAERQNAGRGSRGPLTGGRAARCSRLLPCAEDAGPLSGKRAQVVDWFIVQGENALRSDARYPAGTAAVSNYDGAAPAAELQGLGVPNIQ